MNGNNEIRYVIKKIFKLPFQTYIMFLGNECLHWPRELTRECRLFQLLAVSETKLIQGMFEQVPLPRGFNIY